MIRAFLAVVTLGGTAALLVGHAVSRDALAEGSVFAALLSPNPSTALAAATAGAAFFATRAVVYLLLPPLGAAAITWTATRRVARGRGPTRP